MFEIVTGSLILSAFHAMIPSHWLPLLSISKVENWNYRETLTTTLFTGLIHSIGTIILGIGIGYLGIELAEHFHFFAHWVAPIILIGLGVVYLFMNSHNHKHHAIETKGKSRNAIILTLLIAMFLSPCIEMELYYLDAAKYSWTGIGVVSLVFLIVTSSVMVLFVGLAYNGMNHFNFSFIERHEKKISGFILLVLGMSSILIGH